MEYLATFHTHYGAMSFHKYCGREGIPAKMMPVPRELSASCGVCVRFEDACAAKADEHEDMECCYAVTQGGVYIQAQDVE
jgi:Protein of unknown function (DUF3343).